MTEVQDIFTQCVGVFFGFIALTLLIAIGWPFSKSSTTKKK